MAELGHLVDFVEVVPDRLWYDFGAGERPRFFHASAAIEILRGLGRPIRGHGIGLSLPSAMPLDPAVLDQVAAAAEWLGFEAFSEHLSLFLVPGASVPNAQAGLGLPVLHDEETLAIVAEKVDLLRARLGVPIALENGTIFTAMPEPPMSEPGFLNRLNRACGADALLDLHNLHANCLNLGWNAEAWLGELDPSLVTEIHVAGGDWLHGHYTDSHSNRSPPEVRALLERWAPRFPRLAAITFEYHESYHARIGLDGLADEFAWLHAVAESCAAPAPEPVAPA
jgi:uncharacterized protein (UPF0276 family)